MRIFRPTTAEYAEAPWRDAFALSLEDYLDRSREEISLREEHAVMALAFAGDRNLLLLVALDDEGFLLGWALSRYQDGTEISGSAVVLWQVWMNPLRTRAAELYRRYFHIIENWARARGARRLTLMTFRGRAMRAWGRLVRSMGFTPFVTIYARELGDGESVQADQDDPD